jgi:hypothetical protein
MIRLLRSVIRFATNSAAAAAFPAFSEPARRHHKSKTVVPKTPNRPQFLDLLMLLF